MQATPLLLHVFRPFPSFGMCFYQMINPVTFLAVFIINHRVIEIINVPAGLPGGGMHENSSIDPHDIFMHAGSCSSTNSP